VSLLEVFRYLDEKVPQSATLLGRPRQAPLLHDDGNAARDVILTVDRGRVAAVIQETQRQLAKLLELHSGGYLPDWAYAPARDVLEKRLRLAVAPAGAPGMSPEQSRLLGFVYAFLRGGITREQFLDIARPRGEDPARPDPPPPPPTLKYCTQCGARLSPGHAFCTSCGRKISR
jgi:hypothetical protein